MKEFFKLIAMAIIITLLSLLLVSCFPPNMDPAKAIDALEENNYTAIEDDTILPLVFAGLGIKDVDTVVTGTAIIDEKVEHITIIYFEETEDATEAWEKVKEYAEKEDKKEEDSDWSINKFGNMIWYGTEAALKATH